MSPAEAQASRDAFAEVAKVLRHPRCMNCHPSGDRPHVGDESRMHGMNVMRGPDNHGVAAVQCATCHQDENQDLMGIPGAPAWHLAPRGMGWVGLDDHDLAESLKDRKRNGDRSFADLIHHMSEDPLVAWGWNPGRGREAVPVPHEVFVQQFRDWIDSGAVSPEPGTTTTFPKN